MSILVITTGGTIGAMPCEDFSPDTLAATFVKPVEGHDPVREALQQKFHFTKGRIVSLEFRDSRHMDELYLDGMLDLIEEAPEGKVLITHGTDALLQTANFLYREAQTHAALAEKVILLTGSMVPLSQGPESDGYLNLEFALKQLDHLSANGKENIYVVLCDYEHAETESGAWKPRLYKYSPMTYEKVYTKDGRYNRLRRLEKDSHAED